MGFCWAAPETTSMALKTTAPSKGITKSLPKYQCQAQWWVVSIDPTTE